MESGQAIETETETSTTSGSYTQSTRIIAIFQIILHGVASTITGWMLWSIQIPEGGHRMSTLGGFSIITMGMSLLLFLIFLPSFLMAIILLIGSFRERLNYLRVWLVRTVVQLIILFSFLLTFLIFLPLSEPKVWVIVYLCLAIIFECGASIIVFLDQKEMKENILIQNQEKVMTSLHNVSNQSSLLQSGD